MDKATKGAAQMTNYVYVMRFGEIDHKIGISFDPIRRLREVRVVFQSHADLLKEWARPTNDAAKVESLAHRLLRDWSIGRERFSVNHLAAFSVVETAIALAENRSEGMPSSLTGADLPQWREAETIPEIVGVIGFCADALDARSAIQMRRKGASAIYCGSSEIQACLKDVREGDTLTLSDFNCLSDETKRTVLSSGVRIEGL